MSTSNAATCISSTALQPVTRESASNRKSTVDADLHRQQLELKERELSQLLDSHRKQQQLAAQLAAAQQQQRRQLQRRLRRPEHIATEEMMRVARAPSGVTGSDVIVEPLTPPRRRRASLLAQPNATLTPRLVIARPPATSPLKNVLQRKLDLRQQVRGAGTDSDGSSREDSPSRAVLTSAKTVSSSQHKKNLCKLHVSIAMAVSKIYKQLEDWYGNLSALCVYYANISAARGLFQNTRTVSFGYQR